MDAFIALADPHRRRMMEMLARGGALPVAAIGGRFDISAPAVSQHLKVLREAGLVQVEKKGQQRFYSLHPAGLREMEQWVFHMKQFWTVRLDALESRLEAENNQLKAKTKTKTKRKKP